MVKLKQKHKRALKRASDLNSREIIEKSLNLWKDLKSEAIVEGTSISDEKKMLNDKIENTWISKDLWDDLADAAKRHGFIFRTKEDQSDVFLRFYKLDPDFMWSCGQLKLSGLIEKGLYFACDDMRTENIFRVELFQKYDPEGLIWSDASDEEIEELNKDFYHEINGKKKKVRAFRRDFPAIVEQTE